MSVLARRIRATPERTASKAWMTIVDLLAPRSSAARNELVSVAGIASSIIATEAPKDAPITIRGNGPRLRFYCLYGDDAITGHGADEGALAECPTNDEWQVSLPAETDDIAWLRAALAAKSSRITVREKGEKDAFNGENRREAGADAEINREAFLRP